MANPRHLAIIMDGNGRWAQRRGRQRVIGHIQGARVAKKIIESCTEKKIKHLTLFTFSTENWNRPQEEVTFLMRLLQRHLKRETRNLVKNNIRFRVIGEIYRLPDFVQDVLRTTVESTKDNDGLQLTFALSYGGRQEITEAVRDIAKKVKAGEMDVEEITERSVGTALASSFLPDPDLVIRTSGESRISNFFLWQLAYSELIISNKLWPDFTELDLLEALREFSARERRFGQVPTKDSHELSL